MAVDFEIDINRADGILQEMDSIKDTYAGFTDSIHPLISDCGVGGITGFTLCRRLGKLESTMTRQQNKIGVLYDGLNLSKYKYINSERALLGLDLLQEPEPTTDPESVKEISSIEFSWRDVWKLLANAGVGGAVISSIMSILTGDGTVKSWSDVGKYICKMLGNVVKGIDGKEPLWKIMVGKNKYDVGDAASSAGSIAKWGGYLFTFIGDAYDNYEEFGSMESERFWDETIIETVTDIALSAGATAAFAALLGPGAPVVAVGALAVAAVWAADALCKWATGGRDIAEVVSDSLCNFKEKALEVKERIHSGLEETAKSIGDNIRSSLSNIGTKWRTAFS